MNEILSGRLPWKLLQTLHVCLENNIKMHVREVSCEVVIWFEKLIIGFSGALYEQDDEPLAFIMKFLDCCLLISL